MCKSKSISDGSEKPEEGKKSERVSGSMEFPRVRKGKAEASYLT